MWKPVIAVEVAVANVGLRRDHVDEQRIRDAEQVTSERSLYARVGMLDSICIHTGSVDLPGLPITDPFAEESGIKNDVIVGVQMLQ